MKTILILILLVTGQKSANTQEIVKNDTISTTAYIPSYFPLAQRDFKRVSSPFGYRKHPIHQKIKLHTGIDLAADKGAAVLATASGIVEKSEYQKGYGNYIQLAHSDTIQTCYAHLWVPLVKKGDTVVQGQIIGLVGATGLATGPHLHYEVHLNDKKIDPMLIWKSIIRKKSNNKVL